MTGTRNRVVQLLSEILGLRCTNCALYRPGVGVNVLQHDQSDPWDFHKSAEKVRHLGFVWGVFGPPAKNTWWSLSMCKIWLQLIKLLGNIKVWIFGAFGWKTSIHALKLFCGIWPPKWAQYLRIPPKAHPCASPRRLSYDSLTSRWVLKKV